MVLILRIVGVVLILLFVAFIVYTITQENRNGCDKCNYHKQTENQDYD